MGGGADVRSSKASWGWMKLVLSKATKMVTTAAAPRLVVGDGDPLVITFTSGSAVSATAQSLLGQGLRNSHQ